MWMAAVTGGIWKSENGGQSWAPAADFMANLNVSSLAIVARPLKSDAIFAGTGESFTGGLEGHIRGAGIFRSLDGGRRWHQLSGTANLHFVNRLAVTADGASLFAATEDGVYRSTSFLKESEASVAFERLPSLSGTATTTVLCQPFDADRCVAAAYDGVYWTETANAPIAATLWTPSTGLPSGGRIELAYARANAQVVYASVDHNNGEIYRSTDGGKQFTLRSTGVGYLGHPNKQSQGWYANTIWAGDPMNQDMVVLGGVDLWRSMTGGQRVEKISAWSDRRSAHADQHAIVADPSYNGTTNRHVFVANDGGLYQTNDIAEPSVRWAAANTSYVVTQFYSGAAARGKNAGEIRLVGGTQDNGTFIYEGRPQGGGQWHTWLGGDGGFAAIAGTASKTYFYGSYQYLALNRSNDGTNAEAIHKCAGVPASNCIPDAVTEDMAPFVVPFILDPRDPKVMLAGASSLWRSADVTQPAPAWSAIAPPRGDSQNFISAITSEASDPSSPGASDIVWVGYRDGEIWRLDGAADGTWTPTTVSGHTAIGADPRHKLPQRFVTRLRVMDGELFATFAGYVGHQLPNCTFGDQCRVNENIWTYSKQDRTWRWVRADLLPPMPIYDVTAHPNDPTLKLLATELGVFVNGSTGTSTTWLPVNYGPANVVTHELFWLDTTLFAATYGRGIFALDLPQRPPLNLSKPRIHSSAGTNICHRCVARLQSRKSFAHAVTSAIFK
jgi:hypothetical protein